MSIMLTIKDKDDARRIRTKLELKSLLNQAGYVCTHEQDHSTSCYTVVEFETKGKI